MTPRHLLILGRGLQFCKPILELLADHLIHVKKTIHDLRHIVGVTVHGPRNLRGVAVWRQSEFSSVMPLEWLDKVKLNNDLRWWCGVDDFHTSFTHLVISIPLIDSALIALWSAILAFHFRVHLLPWR